MNKRHLTTALKASSNPAGAGAWAQRSARLLAVAATAWGLSACSLTPAYQRPDWPVPAELPAQRPAQRPADAGQKTEQAANLPWAQYFPDTRLQSLIRLALDHNRDLRVAVLNIDQLRAAYQIQDADRFSTLQGSLSGTRQPANASPYALTTTVSAGVSVAAYELDLFGRVKALSEAAAAQVLASEEARRAVHISLVASVAQAYYTLWADRWQLALADQTLQTRQNSLQLLALKYEHGVLNELDWRAGQSLVESARVARAQAQRQWAQDQHALALLLGAPVPAHLLPPEPDLSSAAPGASTPKPPSSAPAQAQEPQVPPMPALQAALWPGLGELPVGLSSDVLLQRPDIMQAEQQLIAANANIGAARAARFPRISLTASAGVVSDSLSGLFNEGRTAWSVAPALSVPIWDAGRTQAGVASAQVKRDIAVAQYDKAVQTAFKEVADALVARRTYADQAEAQQAQAQAEAARFRVSALRYDTGVASQLDLLDAQRNLFAAQQALIQAQLARQQAHIQVYKALGGGWVDR